jgi:hypothetical protein
VFSTVLNTSEPLTARIKPKRAVHALLPDLEGASTTIEAGEQDGGARMAAGDPLIVGPRSLILLRSDSTEPRQP